MPSQQAQRGRHSILFLDRSPSSWQRVSPTLSSRKSPQRDMFMEFSRSGVHCLGYNAGTDWSQTPRSNARVGCPLTGRRPDDRDMSGHACSNQSPARQPECLGNKEHCLFSLQGCPAQIWVPICPKLFVITLTSISLVSNFPTYARNMQKHNLGNTKEKKKKGPLGLRSEHFVITEQLQKVRFCHYLLTLSLLNVKHAAAIFSVQHKSRFFKPYIFSIYSAIYNMTKKKPISKI